MKQQINLYQPSLFEKTVPFSAVVMGAVLVSALLLALLWAIFGMWRQTSLESDVVQLQRRQVAALQKLEDYKQRYPARKSDAKLAAEVQRMLRDRQARLALVGLLTEKQSGNSHGFSQHLEGLAREDLTTVWLRRIRFASGGQELLLEGSTTRPADVPLYLQRLTRQQDYAGREFDRLQLRRSEDDSRIVDFLLQTSQEEQP